MTKKQLDAFVRKWKKNIAIAKAIVIARNSHQMKIAECALEVCEINWGGNKNKVAGTYTITKFANEIGISNRTLSNYIAIKKNIFDKLEDKTQATVSFTVMGYASSRINRDHSTVEVRKIIHDIVTRGDTDRKIISYTKNLRSLLHLFERTEGTADASRPVVEEVLFYAEALAMTIKKKRKIKGRDNRIVSIYAQKNLSANEALGISKTVRSGSRLGYIGSKNSKRIIKLRAKDIKVIDYLKEQKNLVGPTQIGIAVGGMNKDNASAWSVRTLSKLIEAGLVKKNKKGLYGINHA